MQNLSSRSGFDRSAARIARVALVLALAAMPLQCIAQWAFLAEGGFSAHDNLPRATRASDAAGDTSMTVRTALGRSFALADYSDFSLQGAIGVVRYARFAGLDRIDATLHAELRHKLGLGPRVPTLALGLDATRQSFTDSARDGWRQGLELRLQGRLSSALDYAFWVGAERFLAEPGEALVAAKSADVFSTRGQTFGARSGYALSENLLAYLSVSTRGGDVVASTRRYPEIFRSSDAIGRDPVFGPDYIAYRLVANTRSLGAGLSIALGSRSSINFGFSRDLSRAAENLHYETRTGHVVFAYGF